jgi:hypothetical protein
VSGIHSRTSVANHRLWATVDSPTGPVDERTGVGTVRHRLSTVHRVYYYCYI